MAFRIVSCFKLIAVLLLLNGCEKSSIMLSGHTMGSTYHVTIRDSLDAATARKLEAGIAEVLAEAHKVMTTYDAASELNGINRADVDEWIPVSPVLYRVLQTSVEVSTYTQGAFDISIYPLVKLWGFGPDPQAQRIPKEEDIATILPSVNYRHIQLDSASLRIKKSQALAMDLSGIGHGYGADLVAEYLNQQNIQHYLVEVAGEIRTKGYRQEGEPWRIAIETPEDKITSIFLGVSVSDMGMATSGDYRNYFIHEGVRYSHTLDPTTGYPVSHRLASVTVLDASAAKADALATALLVMGADKGRIFAEQKGIPAYFIERHEQSFQGIATSRFKPFLIDQSEYD